MILKGIFCVVITTAVFLLWEGVAWWSHKYIMHGFLWSWHKSHHSVHHHRFERNDLFFVVFSLPSIGLIIYYSAVSFNVYGISAGVGIMCYGIFYLVFHDILVHQRIPWKPGRLGRYVRRMIHAHYVHHRKHTREGCEAFGFLWAPRKYQPEEFELRTKRQSTQ